MTLFDRVFGGNDAVYGLTEGAIDEQSLSMAKTKLSAFRTPLTAFHVTML